MVREKMIAGDIHGETGLDGPVFPPLTKELEKEKKFDDNSLFECLQEEAKVRVITSEKQIELCRATAAEAKLMKVKKGAPLLYIKSVAYTYDREPLYAGAQVFNGEVCSLYVCESVEQ